MYRRCEGTSNGLRIEASKGRSTSASLVQVEGQSSRRHVEGLTRGVVEADGRFEGMCLALFQLSSMAKKLHRARANQCPLDHVPWTEASSDVPSTSFTTLSNNSHYCYGFHTPTSNYSPGLRVRPSAHSLQDASCQSNINQQVHHFESTKRLYHVTHCTNSIRCIKGLDQGRRLSN